MTVGMQTYKKLLQDFGEISQPHIDDKILNQLKTEYKEEITFNRVLENIVDINTFLKVLEKRGILQYDEIDVLHHIAEVYVHDKSIDDLILSYEQWLGDHLTELNNLYNCGKSSNLIINSEYNIPNESETENLCDNLHENVPNLESEDQHNEILLSREFNINLHTQKYINKKHIFYSSFAQKCSKKQKKYVFIIIIILLLSISTISIIGIFVKISYLSTAIVPGAEKTNTSANHFEHKMPSFVPNVNLGFSSSYSATPTSTADQEKELQTLVTNKISRKIGRYWAEVSRRLDIEEADVDDIENRYIKEPHGQEKMFKEALKIYFSEEHSNWKKDLMHALEVSRRRDLKEDVEKIVYS